MRKLWLQHWFLLALIVVLAVGFTWAGPLAEGADQFPRQALVAVVLFLMSWSLDSTALFHAVRRPSAAVLGVAVNLLVVPLAAWCAARVLPAPLDMGLMLTAALPCTLASAAVWTRRAGGNDAVALVVTMVTNFGCFLFTPLLLWLMTGADVQDRLTTGQLVWRLFLIAVLPMAAGQLLRCLPPAARWATRHKAALSTLCQLGILTMVLIGAVQSALKLSSSGAGTTGWQGWLLMLAAVVTVHLVALYLGFGLGRGLQLPRADWIAVGLAGSQKTLMIGLDLALTLNLGIGILPMIAYHALQLVWDTLVADRLAAGPPANRPPPGDGSS